MSSHEATGRPDPALRAKIEAGQAPLLAIYADLDAAWALVVEAVAWQRSGRITTEQAIQAITTVVSEHEGQKGAGE